MTSQIVNRTNHLGASEPLAGEPFHYPAPWAGVEWGPSRPTVTPLILPLLRLVRDSLWVLVWGTVVVAFLTALTQAGV